MACKPPCRNGWIVRTLEQAGYERAKGLDSRDRVGWITPSGTRCTFQKGVSVEVRQMCTCKRREWNVPAIPLRDGARHPASGNESRLQ